MTRNLKLMVCFFIVNAMGKYFEISMFHSFLPSRLLRSVRWVHDIMLRPYTIETERQKPKLGKEKFTC